MNPQNLQNESHEQLSGRIARIATSPSAEPPEELSDESRRYFTELQQAQQARRDLENEIREVRQNGNKARLSELSPKLHQAQQNEGRLNGLLAESLRPLWSVQQNQQRLRFDAISSAEAVLNAHVQNVRDNQRAREFEEQAETLKARGRNALHQSKERFEKKAQQAKMSVSEAIDAAESFGVDVAALRAIYPTTEVSTNA